LRALLHCSATATTTATTATTTAAATTAVPAAPVAAVAAQHCYWKLTLLLTVGEEPQRRKVLLTRHS
jgi:hypothetical protein